MEPLSRLVKFLYDIFDPPFRPSRRALGALKPSSHERKEHLGLGSLFDAFSRHPHVGEPMPGTPRMHDGTTAVVLESALVTECVRQ